MKIAIFSDIHGNLQALKVILNDLKNNDFDELIFLGDVIGFGPKSRECLDLMLKNNITFIMGNHEFSYKFGLEIDSKTRRKSEIEHHNRVYSLLQDYFPKKSIDFPLFYEKNIDSKKFKFQHYILKDDFSSNSFPFQRIIYFEEPEKFSNYCEKMDCDYLFIGHEHEAFNVEKNNKKIICVGSSGCVFDDKTFYTILEIENGDINISKKYLKFDREEFIKDLKSYNYPDRENICKVRFGVE